MVWACGVAGIIYDSIQQIHMSFVLLDVDSL